jgi:hypothetical protein
MVLGHGHNLALGDRDGSRLSSAVALLPASTSSLSTTHLFDFNADCLISPNPPHDDVQHVAQLMFAHLAIVHLHCKMVEEWNRGELGVTVSHPWGHFVE